MPSFTWTARTAAGELRTARVDAPSRDDVVVQLRRQRLTIVRIEETRGRSGRPGAIRTRDLVVFTRQFSTMISAGLPLVQALDILAKQSENRHLAAIVRDVMADVETGHTLADALRKHPAAFSDLFVNMVAAGESGGILDVILQRLAAFLEKTDALVRKVKGALVYPGVIVAVAALCVLILLWKVIPVFSQMFGSVGMPLPLATRVVIRLSELVNAWWWAVLGGGALVAGGVRQAYRTPAGRLAIDRLLLRLPAVGDLLRKAAVSRFARTLGTLLSSGVGILDGLEITARTAGNRVVHDAILASRASIAGGETIAGPLQRSEAFPPMVISMVAVGEQTGGLDEMLGKIADFYDNEVDTAVSALLSLLEPILIVFLGVVVGGMIVAMYLPIFDLVNAVQ